LRLNKKQRLLAIDLFGLGKKEDFNPEYSLNKLREACARYPELLQTFIQIQIEVQNFSHALSRQKKHVLKQWCLAFGLPIDHFPLLREQADKRSQANRGQGHATSTKTASIGSYAVLGLKQDASQQEIKLAYRKLMSQYHPDKLVSKGLPTELLKFAKEKTQAIQSAYEDICKERGF